MTKRLLIHTIQFFVAGLLLLTSFSGCKSKKKMKKKDDVLVVADTVNERCKLDFKSSKSLIKHIRASEFNFDWVYAKANVEANIDGKEESFDIKVRIRKDSAMLVSIQYLLGVEVAKILITKDSVKMVIYPRKQYFKGDYNYINELLHADLDFDLLQAVLFGNSAEFYDDDLKLKPVTDRQNCRYALSTERKFKLKKIEQGQKEPKKSLQTMTLDPLTFKINKNEFVDVATNRIFTANYEKYPLATDSVYAPRRVNIDIVAEKKVNLKIDYVRIEKNEPQRLTLNIPAKYEPMPIKKAE
ncbi:MAG: DUF4292 domain-containing protein [Bacteroidetes bacterium]|nr:DUF4292 domain-containing protein [Bacteroidota bacterium]